MTKRNYTTLIICTFIAVLAIEIINKIYGNKMATAIELMEFLKSIPDNTEIQVVEVYDCGYSTCARLVPLRIDDSSSNLYYTDFTDNPLVKKDNAVFGKRFLELGEI